MKKIFFVLSIFALFFAGCDKVSVYKEGNSDKKPLEFKKGKVQCVVCTMPLQTKIHSGQAVLPNGRTYFFDDPGCMALWLQKQKNKDSITLWIFTNDTQRYIDARKAWYKLGDRTPMGYGFGAYEKRVKDSVDFDKFLIMMYRGENLTNPALRKKILKE